MEYGDGEGEEFDDMLLWLDTHKRERERGVCEKQGKNRAHAEEQQCRFLLNLRHNLRSLR